MRPLQVSPGRVVPHVCMDCIESLKHVAGLQTLDEWRPWTAKEYVIATVFCLMTATIIGLMVYYMIAVNPLNK